MKALELHIVRERERAELSRLPRSERFARRGQVDLYVASTAANKLKADDDRLWLPAFDLGVTTAMKAELKGTVATGARLGQALPDLQEELARQQDDSHRWHLHPWEERVFHDPSCDHGRRSR